MPDLTTRRLRLRAWEQGDTAFLAQLADLPAVVRFVGDGTTWPPGRAAEVARTTLAHWRRHGFGWRVAIEPAREQPIGFIALNYAGEGTRGLAGDEFEIGWWLDPSAWGHGLATEGARAVRDEAFERVGASSLVARIQPGNHASLHVAAKLGLTFDFETVGRAGERVIVLRLDRAQWAQRAGATKTA